MTTTTVWWWLTRTTEETAAAARAEFLSIWHAEGRRHFRVEEDVLLPAFARHGSAEDEAVVRVLVDHVEIRRRTAELESDPTPAIDLLHDLGERLNRHIRHEERILFPLIEEALSEAELGELDAACRRAGGALDLSVDEAWLLLRAVDLVAVAFFVSGQLLPGGLAPCRAS